MTTQCQHSEYIDYFNGRQLGFCRKCCRIMEYPRDGGHPVDVTDEFGGVAPFYVPPEQPAVIEGQSPDSGPERHSDNYRLSQQEAQRVADSRKRGTQAGVEARQKKAAGQGGGRNNFVRQRYYLANKDAIIADVRELGPTEARKKWAIPSSTFSHLLRVWGVAIPPEKRQPRGKSYYDEQREAISADIKAMPQADVIAKWGMSESTYHRLKRRWGVAYEGDDRAAFDPQPVQFEAPETLTEAAANNVTYETVQTSGDDDTHGLPRWRDDWDSEVQVQWLRTYEALVLNHNGPQGRNNEAKPLRA